MFRIGQSGPSVFLFSLDLGAFSTRDVDPFASVGCHKPSPHLLAQAPPEHSEDAETTNWSHKEENDKDFCIPWHSREEFILPAEC